jgi:hypothetical protein
MHDSIPQVEKYSTKDYVTAFCEALNVSPEEILIERSEDSHAYVKHQDQNYMVSSFDDFVNNFRDYFEKDSYDEIYTMIHCYLWQDVINDYGLKITVREWTTGIYLEWRRYWSNKREQKGLKPEHIEKVQNSSLLDLQMFISAIQADPASVVQSAIEIDELHFVPLIAYVLKSKYGEDSDEFYHDCVLAMVERGLDRLGDKYFESVVLNQESEEDLSFYVYDTEVELDIKKARPGNNLTL